MRCRNKLWRPNGTLSKKSGYGHGGNISILDANQTLMEIIEIAKYQGKPQPAPPKPYKENPRDNHKYRAWRDKIRKRDKSQCVLCGEISWIVVHHIVRWADDEKLRYHEQNGVCLCTYCHAKYHGEKLQPFPIEITDKLIKYVGEIYCKPSI
ncbi:MAG: HNH endonuclease [Porphyromonadaceae bacterium]|nr:HNH endonuclease [Porphyromonadaceae bacterium]